MTAIRTRIRVDSDHHISGTAPAAVTAATSGVADLPVHDLPWDGSVSLRRDNFYDDDGASRRRRSGAFAQDATDEAANSLAITRRSVLPRLKARPG